LFSSKLKLISQGIEKSKQLLELAEAGDWDAFNQLEEERQLDLTNIQLQDLDLSNKQHAHLNNQMQTLIDLNTELEQVCRQQRSELADQMKKFTKGNKAKKAYSQ
jgi:flagellar protein FliT